MADAGSTAVPPARRSKYSTHFPDRDFVWYEVPYPTVLNFLQGNATLEETLETIESEVQGSF